jgi:large subunit ribosomal protein L33
MGSIPVVGFENLVAWRPPEERRMRDLIGLACDGCKRRNYTTSKNKKRQTEKFAIKKFCPSCRTHTVHKEAKV